MACPPLMVKQFLRGFSSAMVLVIERLVSKFQQFYATGGSVQMAVIPASGWRQLWLADPSRAGCVMNQNGDDYRGCDKAWQKEDNTIH
jgi:hypothetical protein